MNCGARIFPVQAKVLALLTAAAAARERCPSNSEIADALDLTHHSKASEVVSALEHKGLIRVERGAASRIVTIVATGHSTATDRSRPTPRALDTSYRGPVPEHLRVARDPCPRCAVRADVGCAHRPARLGLVMAL